MKKEVVIEDWSIVGFLSLSEIQQKYQIEITPFKKSNDRIAFRIRGNVDSAISEIYTNRKVGINDYMRALKRVRHTIFTLKSINTHVKDDDEKE